MKLAFFGAAGQVTGSNTLLEIGSKRILVDCGLFQGGVEQEGLNWKAFAYDPATIDSVVVTHAHLDHCGRLAKLVKDGFKGPIYATDATRDLVGLQLIDAVEVLGEHAAAAGREMLFHTSDIVQTVAKFVPLPYNRTQSLFEGATLTLKDAGHILGAATLTIRAEDKTIVFSGDLGNLGVPILNPPEDISGANYLVLESTYGDRLHPHERNRREDLKAALTQTYEAKGVLLIPAFALERTQEILFEINALAEQKLIPKMPIYLDSPLAISVTDVFRHHENYYNAQTQAMLKKGDDPFQFPNLTFTQTVAESKRINTTPPPKVIIAGSGMLQGGRIVHHLVRYLGDDRTTVLFVGYQVSGTLGRRLMEGERLVHVMDERVRVRAQMKHLPEFSGHADQSQLVGWADQMRSPRPEVFLNHGEKEAMRSLSQHLAQKGLKSIIPTVGESFSL